MKKRPKLLQGLAYCFFVNPNLDSDSAILFGASESTFNILKCSLLEQKFNDSFSGLILPNKDFRFNFVETRNGHSHLLLTNEKVSIQLEFDSKLNPLCPFDFEIITPLSSNLSKQILSITCLESLINRRCFSCDHIISPLKLSSAINVLYAYDLRKLGFLHREVGKKLFGEAAVLDGWDGVSEYIKTKTRRLIYKGQDLIYEAERGFCE